MVRFILLLGLKCRRALKNQSAGSSKAMRWRTEAMTQKGVKVHRVLTWSIICNLNCIPEYGGLGHINGSEIEIKFFTSRSLKSF
jgi:hypothetical protein